VGRIPGDGDIIVTFYLVEKGLDAGNNTLARHWSDQASGEELDAIIAIRDEVVAGRDGSWID